MRSLTRTRTFYYPSQELWERFKDVIKAEGKTVSRVLGEYVDNYLMGYTDPTIPSLNTYFESNPNSIQAVQRRISQEAMKLAEKRGGEITFRELRDLYSKDIPTPDTRNAVVERTAKELTALGVRVWR